MSLSSNFPTSKPSLNLDFANVGALDPRITFTRSSSATYTNSLGLITTAATNVARFDYDPVTLAARGLLIEEQRTNLVLYSQEFDNAYWSKDQSSIVANSVAAPNGTVTADKIVEDTATNTHGIYRLSFTVTSGLTYTWSVYAKKAERNWIILSAGGGANNSAWFNLNTGAAGTIQSGVAAATITSVGNDWYRCSVTRTVSSGSANFECYASTADNTFSYTGDGTSGIYLWGAQLEAGSFATSYIPTVASTVTRSADVASVNTLSPFYNAVEGTIYAEWSMVGSSVGTGYPAISQFDDTTGTNYIAIRQDGVNDSRRYGIVQTSSTVAAMLNGTAESLSANTVLKAALAYKANDFAFTRGSTLGTSSSGAIPAVTNLKLGRNDAGTYINAHVGRIAYYPVRLTNAQLQALTS